MADITEPYPDVPAPVPADEEIVDPTIPAGNFNEVIIRRHPFGLVVLYFEAIVGLVVAFGLLFFLVPLLTTGDTQTRAVMWLSLAAVSVTVFTVVILLIATSIYRQNRWIVTDDSITQVLQVGLFRRQVSELSMANVEDVTAEQSGFIATVLGFGTLKAETAGERSNFHFIYCPRPNTYAKIILDARERFIESDPEKAHRANDRLNVPRG